ncbi:hypothetical protein AB4Y77_18935 [Paenarthrobacter sp. YAF11_1]
MTTLHPPAASSEAPAADDGAMPVAMTGRKTTHQETRAPTAGMEPGHALATSAKINRAAITTPNQGRKLSTARASP